MNFHLPDHTFKIDEYITHHLADAHVWNLPFLPAIHLPKYLSLHGVMVLLCAVFLIILFCVLYKKDQKVPTGINTLLEMFVEFIRDQIAVEAMGKQDGIKMTPFLCSLFFFILGLNLMGLVPLFATATANINVTGALACIILFMLTVWIIWKNGFTGFLKAFVPSGVPVPILFLIVPLEFLGIFIKCFALMIRLFANMLAGHMVIYALLGLVVMVGWLALPAVFLAVAISALEVFIAFLQAYIFTILSAVFIGQMLHPEH